MGFKHERERIFKSEWKKCIQNTITPEFLETFDNACGTHLRTHRIEHEWEALYEFIVDHVFPKWIDKLIEEKSLIHQQSTNEYADTSRITITKTAA